jgi:homoserine O-acetyltransferase
MKNKLFLVLVLWINLVFAQSDLHLINIGDFKTINGDTIKNCKIGYRTAGKLNTDKSNIVLWPTWFNGSSKDIIDSGLHKTIDTTGLYIIIVDALSNGVSSSPSNTSNFPKITIRDMVNSQYELLLNHLNINHVFSVIGISMGGMQAFEWLVAYPDFMDKAIPIIGTPKQSFYDLLVWQTQADLIVNAGSKKKNIDFAMKKVYDILNMNATTPSFLVRNINPDGINAFRNEKYAHIVNSKNYLAGLNAMIDHDIYKSSKSDLKMIKNLVKADILLIIAQQDHLVNPTSTITFSKAIDCELLELKGDCGHGAPFCEHEKVKKAISYFLK